MRQSSGVKDLVFSFINVKNPQEAKSRELRRQVSHHVGKYHRNRSKPTQKKTSQKDAVQDSALVQLNHNNILGEGSCGDGEAVLCSWTYSPLSRLSQNRANPFVTYAIDSSQVSVLVDHAVQHFWSHLSPSHEFGCYNPVNTIYLAHMQSSQIAFYSYTLAISTNLDYLHMAGPHQDAFQSMRARCIHAATKLVRESIESMPSQPSKGDIPDELIGSILALSCSHVTKVKSTDHPPSRFTSPLAAMQCIDMWSAIPFIKSHRLAVAQLVKLKGGLNGLDSVYLAAVVQLNDLIDASRKIRKPLWAWQSMVVDPPSVMWPFAAAKDSALSSSLLSAFVPLTKNIPRRRELERAISAVAEVTTRLELYQHSIGKDMVEMVELRNRAQHLVLDLDPLSLFGVPMSSGEEDEDDIGAIGGDQEAINVPNLLYEVIRTTLLIYNNLVIYPMSFASHVETRLAKQLQVILHSGLQAKVLDFATKPRTNLLVWSVVLGGISTEDAEDGGWFQAQYCGIIRENGHLRSWISTVELLSSFIWLDFVLHEQAKKFWTACQCGKHLAG